MNSEHVILVNNTNCNISMFIAGIVFGIKTGDGLPDELADLFTLTVISVDGLPRGILNAA